MNIDDFLDGESASSSSNVKNSLSLKDNATLPDNSAIKQDIKHQSTHTDEIDFLNESISQSWDDQVAGLVSLINQSVAEDEYDFAIQKYLELKELPSKIIESDLKTQANLKKELQAAHEKLTAHMQKLEEKHSEQTSQLKQLLSLAFEELASKNEVTASNLYTKACALYNELPSEFQARNVKLHYDLLKLFFAIREAHDVQVDASQSQFVDSFTQNFDQAMLLIQSDLTAAKRMHDELHDNVLKLPNEEIKLKSELLEKLVGLKNAISVAGHQVYANQTAQSNAQSGMQSAQVTVVDIPPLPNVQKIADDLNQRNAVVREKIAPVQSSSSQNTKGSAAVPETKPSSASKSPHAPPPFEKKISPLVEKKTTPVAAPQPNMLDKPLARPMDAAPVYSSATDDDAIARLRSIPKGQKPDVVGDSAHLESLHDRAKLIKERLRKLHESLGN